MLYCVTWDVEEFFRLERAGLVLVHLLEVLVQLLQFFLRDYIIIQIVTEFDRTQLLTVEVFELFLLSLKFSAHFDFRYN